MGATATRRAHSQVTDGFIYFAEADARPAQVKIGWSSNPEARMQNLKIRYGWPLRVKGVLRGAIVDERRLHQELGAYRLDGEWFALSPDVSLVVQCAEPYDPTHLNLPVPAYGDVTVLPGELKAWRRILGWTQAEAAKWMMTAPSRYMQWERGRRPIDHPSLVWRDMNRAIESGASSTG